MRRVRGMLKERVEVVEERVFFRFFREERVLEDYKNFRVQLDLEIQT
jgi:hypothetical protein